MQFLSPQQISKRTPAGGSFGIQIVRGASELLHSHAELQSGAMFRLVERNRELGSWNFPCVGKENIPDHSCPRNKNREKSRLSGFSSVLYSCGERESGGLSRTELQDFAGFPLSRAGRKIRAERLLRATASKNVLGHSCPPPSHRKLMNN